MKLLLDTSIALWAIAIKHTVRPAEMPLCGADARRYFDQSGYRMLTIEPKHVLRVEQLPRIHDDRFDRLLVAQAIEAGCLGTRNWCSESEGYTAWTDPSAPDGFPTHGSSQRMHSIQGTIISCTGRPNGMQRRSALLR